jgi:glutamate/tyrosine decarboxylase-like PLP-dependent enzyme
VLALASLGSFAVIRAANALHASDEYVGVLLAGSTWPLLVGFVVWRRAARRRRDGQERPVLTLIGS